MHALIIEDEPFLACMIEDVLRDNGVRTVDIVATYHAAIAAAAKRPPQLITADVNLAQGSGIDAVEAITLLVAAQVVFVTGAVAEVHARLPDAVIVPKPFSADALQRVVVAAVGRRGDA